VAITRITIEEFLELRINIPAVDVRSPAEYEHAHVRTAANIPLFNNDERHIIGTIFKQQSREAAIKKGLEFFGPKMPNILEQVEKWINQQSTSSNGNEPSEKSVLVYCWRGGMRSGAIAWLLDLYGFKVYQLIGGYKAFRQWVLALFERRFNFIVLGGYTGSGKTKLLHELSRMSEPAIDLEKLAHHKGSAFGALGEEKQPSTEMFENNLALELSALSLTTDTRIWVEDESRHIGRVNIPANLWEQMRRSPIYFLDIDFETRLDYLVQEYGKFDADQLISAILRIKKRLGGLEAKSAIAFLLENDVRECFKILLQYYDKLYLKGLHNREDLSTLLHKIQCKDLDAQANAIGLIQQLTAATWK
jgi:tRNA 2-selenouridine synthase